MCTIESLETRRMLSALVVIPVHHVEPDGTRVYLLSQKVRNVKVVVPAGTKARINGTCLGDRIVLWGDGKVEVNTFQGDDTLLIHARANPYVKADLGCGNDYFEALLYDDADIYGGGGNDTLIGGGGPDTLNGGAGDDLIKGGGGNDLLIGEGGRDRIFGQGGNDILYGARAVYHPHGNDGNYDLLDGGKGRDRVIKGDNVPGEPYEWDNVVSGEIVLKTNEFPF